jgi:hypothetical protein
MQIEDREKMDNAGKINLFKKVRRTKRQNRLLSSIHMLTTFYFTIVQLQNKVKSDFQMRKASERDGKSFIESTELLYTTERDKQVNK